MFASVLQVAGLVVAAVGLVLLFGFAGGLLGGGVAALYVGASIDRGRG